MAERVFTKDVMLDLLVNIIPLGIMAFFMGLFVIWGPFSWDPLYSTLMLGIIGGAFVLLTVLTYVSAIAIEGDANEREAAERAAEAEAEANADEATPEDAPTVTDGEGTTDDDEPTTTGATDDDDRAESADGDEEYEEVF